MNKYILLFSLFVFGCAHTQTSATTIARAENVDIYSPIASSEVPPLETVSDPIIEQTTEARPLRLRPGTEIVRPDRTSYTLTVDHMLFTGSAAAFVLAETMALRDRAVAALNSQRERDYLRLTTLNEEWRLRLNADRERFRIIHEADRTEIDRLFAITEQSIQQSNSFPWEYVLTGAGLLIVGIATGLLSGFFLAN